MAARLSAPGGAFAIPQNAEINVTPFVDVMLVLLIIFMVAIPAATVSVKVDLPQAAASAEPTLPPTYVSLQQDGGLYIGDTPTTLAALPTDLARTLASAHPRAERIYIRADAGVRYGAFMTVMNTLKADGYERVALVSEAL